MGLCRSGRPLGLWGGKWAIGQENKKERTSQDARQEEQLAAETDFSPQFREFPCIFAYSEIKTDKVTCPDHQPGRNRTWDLKQSCLIQTSYSLGPGAVLEKRAENWKAEMQLPPSEFCIRLTLPESIILQSHMWSQKNLPNANSF